MPEVLDEDRPAAEAETDRDDDVAATTTPWGRVRAIAHAHLRRTGVAILVILALVAGAAWWWSSRDLPDDVAVRVGEKDVRVTDLRTRMATVEALYGVTVPDDEGEREAFWKDAAQSVAVGLVLADAVEDEDVAITDNDVDQALQQVVTSFYGEGQKGQAAFADALGNAGTSQSAVRDELERQLEINALFATVTSDVQSPTADEVAAAYDERRCTLSIPERRRIRNIVTATRADAGEALRRLRTGQSFTAVASALSIDRSTRDNGGDLGVVSADELEDRYATAAFGVGRGALFGPVQSEFGWNVGLVETIEKGRVPTLAEVSDQLRQTLFGEAQSRVWRSWLRSRLEQAEIEYNDDYRPADPLELPADSAAGAPAAAGDTETETDSGASPAAC